MNRPLRLPANWPFAISAATSPRGNGYEMGLADEVARARMNTSSIHVDFMLGSDEVDVTGTTRGGEKRLLLRDASWQI